MLSFTLLDEPPYVIYAINRIIQVREGALEANMKRLILHLSQRNTGMVSDIVITNMFYRMILLVKTYKTYKIRLKTQKLVKSIKPG